MGRAGPGHLIGRGLPAVEGPLLVEGVAFHRAWGGPFHEGRVLAQAGQDGLRRLEYAVDEAGLVLRQEAVAL